MDPGASQTLLDAARTGSEEAKEALLARYAGRLLALIRLRMGPSLRAHLESQDLLQATLLKSYARLRDFRGDDPAALMAWLAAIARHEVADQVDFQRRQREPGGGLHLHPQGDGVARVCQRREVQREAFCAQALGR